MALRPPTPPPPPSTPPHPHPPCPPGVILSVWNPDASWERDDMLRVVANMGVPTQVSPPVSAHLLAPELPRRPASAHAPL